MQTLVYLLLFTFVIFFNVTHAQEVERESKITLSMYGGFGFGTVKNDSEPNYNLNSNLTEFLFEYKVNRYFGLATGIGVNYLTGNGFNDIGNFYQERNLLKIPVLITLDEKISKQFNASFAIGFYGQNIIKDEYRFLNDIQKDIYGGWNFGFQIGVGLTYQMSDRWHVGINYLAQSDFGNFETNTNAEIVDEQKIDDLNTVGLIVMFDL